MQGSLIGNLGMELIGPTRIRGGEDPLRVPPVERAEE